MLKTGFEPLNRIGPVATMPPLLIDRMSSGCWQAATEVAGLYETGLSGINMGLKRDTLERQLAQATEDLDKRVKELDAKGVASELRKRDPMWRHFNARCRQVRRRLLALAAVVARDEECVRRKAEKEAAAG